ncbi:hypothetical protein AGOR_G00008390 [Albula goreensis]|uniref:Uncharacterized protein n=1 Tax=Albula goreensis TaxID=1534307 RepID=A0A8T3EBL3_9TELE|nr:hypothetical protein AGOR_G00008390 [Albula goreensis]
MVMESSQSVTAETQSETILKPVDCKTCSLKSTVTEELHKQEIATLTSTGDTSGQALGPNTSAPQARRSRFPKPKPNLVHKVRTQRAAPPQSTEHSAAAATVEPESLKTVEVEKEAMDCMLKEQVHDNLRNDGPDEQKAALQMENRVSESDSSCQDVPPGGERHFAKTEPILDTAGQKPLVPLSFSTIAPDKGDDQRVLVDAEAQRPTEEDNSASSENIASFEPNNKSQDNISTEDTRMEGQTKMNPLVEEEVDGCCSTVTLTERCSADDGEKRHETSASTDTVLEQTSLHMEGDLSAAVSCQATEDHQSTFILTLFEVSPPMLSEYVSGEDPAGTVTAELLSPLVLVDEQTASLPMQTESADVMNEMEAAVEMEAEHGQVSHMKDGGPIEADSEELGDGAGHRSVRTEFSTDVTSHRMLSSETHVVRC